MQRPLVVSRSPASLSDLALAGGSGLISGLAFIQAQGGFLLWCSLVPFFYALWRGDWQWDRLWRLALAWSLPYNLCGLFFLTNLHSLEWRGLTYAQSLIFAYGAAWVGVSLLLVPALLAWCYGLYRLRPQGLWRLVLPVVLWVLMEWAQRHVPLALPWNTLALSQASYPPVIQLAALTGSLGISALMVLVNNALALSLLSRRWRMAALAVGLAAANLLAGRAYLASRPEPVPGTGVTVAVIQGNIRPDVNWSPSSFTEMLTTFREMTVQASLATPRPQLIVWPESALPVDVPHTPWLDQLLRDLARSTNAALAVGALEVRPDDQRIQNNLGLYDPAGGPTQWYHKRHLVPFGEYTPGGGIIKPVLSAMGLDAANTLPADAMPGEWPGPLRAATLHLGPLICFETVFPHVVREAVTAGADALIEVTNDAWFKSSIALVQHNGHGTLRAVENHRYAVRAAITGISAVIDPYGRQLATSRANEQTIVTGEIWPMKAMTPYGRFGDWFVGVCGGLLVVFAALERRRSA